MKLVVLLFFSEAHYLLFQTALYSGVIFWTESLIFIHKEKPLLELKRKELVLKTR